MPWRRLEYGKPSSEQVKHMLGNAKFYIDHNVDNTVVEMLRYLKHDVETAADIRSESQSDEFHFKRALDTKRILLTQDKDFLIEDRFPFSQTRGIIVLNIDSSSPSEIAHALEVIHLILGIISPVLNESKVILNSDYTFSIITREPTFPGWRVRKNRYRVDSEYAYIWEDS